MLKYLHQFRIILIFCLFCIINGTLFAVPVNFAVPSSGEGIRQLSLWSPLIKLLKEETGLDINLVITRNHEIIREEMKLKNYDFALIDPFWYKYWQNRGFCFPFLETGRRETDGFHIILIVHKGSVFRTLKDLENRSIALTVPFDSASGFYIPLAMMFEHNIEPFTYFKAIVFPETFESVLKGIAYGKLDSGFITSDLLDNPENSRYKDEIRIIMESEVLPGQVIVVRKDFNQELLCKIREAIIHIVDSKRGAELVNQMGFPGFMKSGEEEYDVLEKYLNILELNDASPE